MISVCFKLLLLFPALDFRNIMKSNCLSSKTLFFKIFPGLWIRLSSFVPWSLWRRLISILKSLVTCIYYFLRETSLVLLFLRLERPQDVNWSNLSMILLSPLLITNFDYLFHLSLLFLRYLYSILHLLPFAMHLYALLLVCTIFLLILMCACSCYSWCHPDEISEVWCFPCGYIIIYLCPHRLPISSSPDSIKTKYEINNYDHLQTVKLPELHKPAICTVCLYRSAEQHRSIEQYVHTVTVLTCITIVRFQVVQIDQQPLIPM